jgi:hypothetical protein
LSIKQKKRAIFKGRGRKEERKRRKRERGGRERRESREKYTWFAVVTTMCFEYPFALICLLASILFYKEVRN